MRFFPDSWYVEIDEEINRVVDYFQLAIKDQGLESQILSQETGTGYLLKEFRVKGLGEIYIYFLADAAKTAIEINMDNTNREEFGKILRSFAGRLPKRPYGLLDFGTKKKWDEVLG